VDLKVGCRGPVAGAANLPFEAELDSSQSTDSSLRESDTLVGNNPPLGVLIIEPISFPNDLGWCCDGSQRLPYKLHIIFNGVPHPAILYLCATTIPRMHFFVVGDFDDNGHYYQKGSQVFA